MSTVFGTIARQWRAGDNRPAPRKTGLPQSRPILPDISLQAIRLPQPRFLPVR